MTAPVNREFSFLGINHLAMVARDMAETIDFYEGILGMPLVKTIALPDDGQHFFFYAGNETLLAFFWFPNAPQARRGESSPAHLPAQGDMVSAIGSCNHIAFTVPVDLFDAYVVKLQNKGVTTSEIMNHDYSKWQMSRRNHAEVWLRSVYFWDPNGIMLELATLKRPFTAADVSHDPKNAVGDDVPLAATAYGKRLAGNLVSPM
jgi:catechol 2,3-dioxygenase-like lactoylglutathione lyase family enzyme